MEKVDKLPVRVAHIVEDMKIGGQERVIQSILTLLDRDRYEPLLLCLSRGGVIADEIKSSGIKTEILNIKKYFRFDSIRTVSKWLKRSHVKIIHTHGHSAGTLGRLAALSLTNRIVMINHVHTVHLDMKTKQHIKERLLGLITDKTICCSKAVSDFIKGKKWIAERKIAVVYNGIDDPLPMAGFGENEIRSELGVKPKDKIVGAVASLTPHKDHITLFNAFTRVLKKYPDTTLLLLGDGPMRPKLQELSKQLGLSKKIIFLGNRKNVFPFISIFDLFVLPSGIREGLPLSILESMAMNKPVVASKLHGIVEVVDNNKTGLLVPPHDLNKLTGAIVKLLKDKRLREQMGTAGRDRYLSHFTSDLMIRKVEGIYEEVLQDKGLFTMP